MPGKAYLAVCSVTLLAYLLLFSFVVGNMWAAVFPRCVVVAARAAVIDATCIDVPPNRVIISLLGNSKGQMVHCGTNLLFTNRTFRGFKTS